MKITEVRNTSNVGEVIEILLKSDTFNDFDKELDIFQSINKIHGAKFCRIIDIVLNHIQIGNAHLFDKEPLIVSLKYIFENKELLKNKIKLVAVYSEE